MPYTICAFTSYQAFSQKRQDKGKGRAKEFSRLRMTCDSMHFKNHSNNDSKAINKAWAKFCREECDPEKHEVTRMANTEVCEQVRAGGLWDLSTEVLNSCLYAFFRFSCLGAGVQLDGALQAFCLLHDARAIPSLFDCHV